MVVNARTRNAWLVLAGITLVAGAVEPFAVGLMGAPIRFEQGLGILVRTIAASLAGVLLIRRLDHRIGKLLVLLATTAVVAEYIESAAWAQPTTRDALAWTLAASPLWIVFFLLFLEVLWVFPAEDRTPSVRRATFVGYALVVLGWLLSDLFIPRISSPYGPPGTEILQENPFALADLQPVALAGLVLGGTVAAPLLIGALVRLIRRYRGADPTLRLQLKWLIGAFGLAFGGLLVGNLLGLVIGFERTGERILSFSWYVSIAALPVAIAVAILKHRLFDIDLVIKKAVVFAILVALLTGVFFLAAAATGALVGRSTGSDVLVAFLVGGLLVPMWRLSRRIADRLVYGGRAAPGEVLSGFAERLSETYAVDDVLPRMAAVVGEATRALEARVWVRVGGEFRERAAWPADDDDTSTVTVPPAEPASAFPWADHVSEIRDRGELLGTLTLRLPANDPIDAPRERLVRDIASQAGLVLRNVRLIEELRASRQRLVAAQDEERRRLERDLHDGAQQQLVALSVKARLARSTFQRDAQKAEEILEQIEAETAEALENLRDLARGIYPPLLADEGLAAAIEAQARKSPISVEVDRDAVGRYPQAIEAAVYFCALEALNNMAKYSRAISGTVRLDSANGELRFEVTDDGVGFDPSSTGGGTGLQGMADRLDAIGGSLEIHSTPGEGTTVIGHVPAREVGS